MHKFSPIRKSLQESSPKSQKQMKTVEKATSNAFCSVRELDSEESIGSATKPKLQTLKPKMNRKVPFQLTIKETNKPKQTTRNIRNVQKKGLLSNNKVKLNEDLCDEVNLDVKRERKTAFVQRL